jgi:hypothetical protein
MTPITCTKLYLLKVLPPHNTTTWILGGQTTMEKHRMYVCVCVCVSEKHIVTERDRDKRERSNLGKGKNWLKLIFFLSLSTTLPASKSPYTHFQKIWKNEMQLHREKLENGNVTEQDCPGSNPSSTIPCCVSKAGSLISPCLGLFIWKWC